MKSQRKVVVENDKLKEKLIEKKTHVDKIGKIQSNITKLENERKELMPLYEEISEEVRVLAEEVKIETKEGETVTAVDVKDDILSFTVTNNELFLKEETQKQVDKLWTQCDEELKKLNERDGNK